MKRLMLLAVSLLSILLLPAQGVYQLWGVTPGNTGTLDYPDVTPGAIFNTDAAGNNFRLRYQFNTSISGIGDPNGSTPLGSLTFYKGKLYGRTMFGGNNDQGVIFQFDPSANVYTRRFDLIDSSGSNLYDAGLTPLGGKFYGVTSIGGSYGIGVIFEWDPATNVYTKKFDFNVTDGRYPLGNLIFYGGKLYGMTNVGGATNQGVIFEWDPATNIYTKKIDFTGSNGANPLGSLTLSGGKFYGMTSFGGVGSDGPGRGVLFEWDPINNVYTKKIDFDNSMGIFPLGSLTLIGNKFFGLTSSGGSSGVIFEWDPATNTYTKKFDDFNSVNGLTPGGSLILSGDKFYGITNRGGSNDMGVIFEWDSATNVYTKKKEFDETEGEPSYILTRAPAPVANGLAGSCINFPSVTIDESNNNKWVPLVDNEGNAVAEIKANGNNLGIVSASMYINNAAVREDASKNLYLDRNITLTPQVQPTSAVNIRLYIKGSEFLALKNAVNSNGQPSGISSINDVGIYKNDNNCSPATLAITNLVVTATETWEEDYVLSASISSFSSFYFANKTLACPGPEIQCNADTIVNANENHCGAIVRFKEPVVTDACGISTVTQIAGLHSGAFFPVGATINTFVATSSSGKTDTCNFTVSVKDNEPPFITTVLAYPELLWPPDHKMKNVSVNYFAWDNCGPASCSLSVSSNEPAAGTGYGDKAPDWVILNNHHVQLRAERSGRGDGRIYTVTVTCTDASGNSSTQKTRVIVPHQLHEHHSKGFYDFNEENDGQIDANGDYFGELFDCRVTPNPSAQNFNLEIKSVSGEKIDVSLFDISGRLISKPGTVKNNTLRFGDNLRPGVYILEVKQGQQKRVIKVIKQ